MIPNDCGGVGAEFGRLAVIIGGCRLAQCYGSLLIQVGIAWITDTLIKKDKLVDCLFDDGKAAFHKDLLFSCKGKIVFHGIICFLL